MAKREKGPQEPGSVEKLADWILAIDSRDIPQSACEQAKLLILDTIGCGIAGQIEHAAQAVLKVALGAGGGPCTVIGRKDKAGATAATFANGVLIRVLDLNDYVIGGDKEESGGHPSDNIPAALAAGEMAGSSGRDILAAIVVGYEVFARGRTLIDPTSPWDGVCATGLAVPAMAGRLLGLDRLRFANGLALALARAATPAAVRTGNISAAKSIANALVAESAMQGMLLAKAGVTGPLGVLDQERGLKPVFAGPDSAVVLTAPLPDGLTILRSNIKDFPCLATGQTVIEAGRRLHKLIGGNIDGIARLRLVQADSHLLRRQQADPGRIDPTSREAADHSFNFLAAVSVIDGVFGLAQFDNDRWNDPLVRCLMERIVMTTDAQLNARTPGGYPCVLEAQMHDGTRHSADVPYPPGISRGGLNGEAVRRKFAAVTAPYISRSCHDRIVDAAMALDTATSVAALWDALTLRD